uniref:Beta/alpha-defensin C-terminal domain-containing protein n=1 Tax=Gorilla gorilla gorilla TaxID=9595 RepID=G3SBD9_GORGO
MLFLCVFSLLGVFGGISDPVTCLKSGAICHPVFCPRRYKQIGTCGLPGTKCCKKP